jgi:hypothetical protein
LVLLIPASRYQPDAALTPPAITLWPVVGALPWRHFLGIFKG